MKKILLIGGLIVVIGAGWIGARWIYYVNEYKQHLPRTEISVNDVTREYYLFTPSNEADSPSPLLITLQGGGADRLAFQVEGTVRSIMRPDEHLAIKP